MSIPAAVQKKDKVNQELVWIDKPLCSHQTL